jgi:hypothetical protein
MGIQRKIQDSSVDLGVSTELAQFRKEFEYMGIKVIFHNKDYQEEKRLI